MDISDKLIEWNQSFQETLENYLSPVSVFFQKLDQVARKGEHYSFELFRNKSLILSDVVPGPIPPSNTGFNGKINGIFNHWKYIPVIASSYEEFDKHVIKAANRFGRFLVETYLKDPNKKFLLVSAFVQDFNVYNPDLIICNSVSDLNVRLTVAREHMQTTMYFDMLFDVQELD